VKVPERAGDLVFHIHDLVDPAIVKPKEGMLVLFPSYLDHAVTKNLSTEYEFQYQEIYYERSKNL
jgi:hypothetical protein